jgi:type II secretory pathway pseudopilin PulG
MRCRERGLALVTVLVLLAVLLAVALIFSDKVSRATQEERQADARDQALHAATAGIELARQRLAATYRTSSGWAAYLATVPGGTRYPETPAFTVAVERLAVDIFLRDNPDGDGDPRRDNDLQLFVLARSRPAKGAEVLIECLCGFDAGPGHYRQAGQDSRRSGQAVVDGPAEPWSAPVASFALMD